MISIVISTTEWRIIKGIGKLRYEETKEHGTDMQQDKKIMPLDMVIDGVLTEYAVAKYLNLFFDLNCNYRKFDADLFAHNGKTIDVKSTRKFGGPLNAVKRSENKPADIFVLTEIQSSQVAIVGWIPRDRFLCKENLRNVGNGDFYSIDRSMLYPFYELKDREALW